jgi:phage protein D
LAKLRPTFSVTVGSFHSTTDSAVGGPVHLTIARSMDVPADALELVLTERRGIDSDDDVAVELGHDGENERVFTGTVTAVMPEAGPRSALVRVVALGKMNQLLNLRKASTYENQAAGAIVSDLAGAAHLATGTISDGPTLPRFVVDQRRSAFVHAKGLADRLGYEIYTTRRGELMFQALGAAANLDAAGGGLLGAVASAASSLLGVGGGVEGYAYGKHLLAVRAAKRPQNVSAIQVGGESPMSTEGDRSTHWLTKEDTSFQGSAGSGEPHLLVLDAVARTKDLADRFAAGRLAVAARGGHQVRVTVLGRPGLDLGDSLTVSDVPDGLANSGGYVRTIRHRFGGSGGFLTEVTIATS